MTNSSFNEIIAKHDDNAKKICMTWITIAMVKKKVLLYHHYYNCHIKLINCS